PGGRSVADLLQKLSPTDVDWSKVEIFMIDERVVSIDDTESNYKQAHDLFLSRVKAQRHPFLIEKGVEKYNYEFQSAGAHFDLIVLGVGEDGHIAALFPNHPALKIKGKKYIRFDDSPKLPKKRITASLDIIKDADVIFLLFVSAGKKKAYNLFVNKKTNETECPAKIALGAKEVFVFTEFS
ncbi:MAG: 6-phosphogluconolactonase, partial [Nanoarchaeota archaeon]|nr:6-phosphogluconolactonase [Nanoarchaeota archaeon]